MVTNLPPLNLVDIIILAAIALISFLGVRYEIRDIRSGHRCACSGDCSSCRIKCRTNEKYYGVQKKERKR